jgi:hypothetical protein
MGIMPFTHPTLAVVTEERINAKTLADRNWSQAFFHEHERRNSVNNHQFRRFCFAEFVDPVIAVNDWWVEANQHSTPAKRNSSLNTPASKTNCWHWSRWGIMIFTNVLVLGWQNGRVSEGKRCGVGCSMALYPNSG